MSIIVAWCCCISLVINTDCWCLCVRCQRSLITTVTVSHRILLFCCPLRPCWHPVHRHALSVWASHCRCCTFSTNKEPKLADHAVQPSPCQTQYGNACDIRNPSAHYINTSSSFIVPSTFKGAMIKHLLKKTPALILMSSNNYWQISNHLFLSDVQGGNLASPVADFLQH